MQREKKNHKKLKNQSLVKIGTLIFQKRSKDDGIYSKNIFRKAKKSLAFERQKLNSPFLFHYETGSPMVFHLCNLAANTTNTYNLYNQTSHFDIEQHSGKIYFCGGHINGQPLNTCWSLCLSNYGKVQGIQINNLNVARYNTSLLSTPLNLYIVGGYNSSYMNSCEMLEKSGNWKIIAKLHTSSCFITLAYVHP